MEDERKRGRQIARRRPNPQVARWLAGISCDADEDEQEDAPDWDRWTARLQAAGRLAKVGGVLVDRAVLEQRFACVSERCAPSPGRGRARCCCADLEVHLEALEMRQLERHGDALSRYLARREPRLGLGLNGGKGERRFWREGELLSRPEGRCVFSLRDRRGRLRCHLHAFARQAGIARSEVQPLTCRIFPLLLVDLGRGRLVLSVLAKHNYKQFGCLSPKRFPCLSDPSLPPAYESLRGDLDWVFGEGFAAELEALAKKQQTMRGP